MVDKEEVGVLCSWCSLVCGSVNVFQICDDRLMSKGVCILIYPFPLTCVRLQAIVYNVPLTAALKM